MGRTGGSAADIRASPARYVLLLKDSAGMPSSRLSLIRLSLSAGSRETYSECQRGDILVPSR